MDHHHLSQKQRVQVKHVSVKGSAKFHTVTVTSGVWSTSPEVYLHQVKHSDIGQSLPGQVSQDLMDRNTSWFVLIVVLV